MTEVKWFGCHECGDKDWILVTEEPQPESSMLACLRCGYSTRSYNYPGEHFKIYGAASLEDVTEVSIILKIEKEVKKAELLVDLWRDSADET